MRSRTIAVILGAFGLGILAGRGAGPSAAAQDKSPADPYAEMLHVGVVVKDLDQAVARWKAMGFTDIRVSPPNKGRAMPTSVLARAKRVVVKVGSSLVTNQGHGLDHAALAEWAEQIAQLKQRGRQILLVSSGALAESMKRL